MKAKLSLALAGLILLALLTPTSLIAEDDSLPPGTAPPDWLAKPDALARKGVYPELANDLGLGGHVLLDCRIDSHGAPETCHVVSQSPPAMGFGVAALRLSAKFRFRPAVGLAGPVPSHVRIPIRFVPPQDDLRRAIPFMALLAAGVTVWGRRRSLGKLKPMGDAAAAEESVQHPSGV
jgi:TonB family protein